MFCSTAPENRLCKNKYPSRCDACAIDLCVLGSEEGEGAVKMHRASRELVENRMTSLVITSTQVWIKKASKITFYNLNTSLPNKYFIVYLVVYSKHITWRK